MDITDISDIPVSPRKKLKVQHTLGEVMDHLSPVQALRADDQSHSPNTNLPGTLDKEAECGITEYVSPDLSGFVGVLKKRYTDFLVNEILPSGVVVHLDELKAPSHGKQSNQSNTAKTTSSALTGNSSSLAPAPIISIDPSRTDDQAATSQTKVPLADDEPNSFYDDGDGGVALPKAKEVEHEISSNPQVLSSRKPSLELASPSNPRRKEKVILNHTSTGWVAISEKEEAERILAESKLSLEPKEGSLLELKAIEEGGVTVNDQPENDVIPEQRHEDVKSSPAQWQAYANASTSFQVGTEDRNLLLSFFGAEAVDAILALYSHIINSPHRKAREYGLVKVADITDRGLRTSIHQAIRRIFSSRLETMTQDDGAMVISAAAPKSNWTTRTPTGCNERGKKPQQKGKPGWQELGGDYLHFTLYKENKDTMEVISYLARQLKMKPQAFQFAGTKDRRGITVQRVSVYRVIADRMVNAGRTLRNAKIGNYQYQQNGLRLGDLRGNEFVVTLRDCDFGFGPQSEGQADSASDIVKTAIENLRERGYINYYGLQRFGTFSTRTDAVGVKMLQGDFRAAVEAILDYSSTSLAAAQNPLSTDDKISVDDKARAHALHLFKTSGKVYPALQQLPKKFSAEASIIRHLGNPERSNDFLGALQAISRNLRLMYVHAYQSLVWNVVASERWKRFGNQVVDGDLVLVDEHGDKGQVTTVPEDLDVDGEIIVQPGENDRAGNADDIFARARALTADEVKSGKYSIFDIVLPTPGYDILYPANEIVDVYKDFMASTRGGNLDPHDMRRKWKDISLSGSYRKFLARPGQDISYEIRCYENENEQFVQTDLDRLFEANKQRKPIHPTQTIEASEEKGESGVESGESKKERQASKIAVILKLQLGASQYATMALRELMKADGLKTYKPDYGGGR